MVRRKQLREIGEEHPGRVGRDGREWHWWDRKRVVSRGQREARAGNESYSARGEVMKDFTQGSDSF